MAFSDTHQLIWRFYFVTGKLHSGILTKRKEKKTLTEIWKILFDECCKYQEPHHMEKVIPTPPPPPPNKNKNKPLVWKRDCGWPFLQVLFRHLWQSLPVFPSELTGSVQRPYLRRYFRCLRARLETWSGGNGREPRPAHRVAVVLQIPDKQKWWTVFRGCWNTVSSFCVSSFLRSLLNILTKNDIALVTSHRGKSRGISHDNLLALPRTLSRREEIEAISRAPGKKGLVARNLFRKGPGREAAVLLPSNFIGTMLNGVRLF